MRVLRPTSANTERIGAGSGYGSGSCAIVFDREFTGLNGYGGGVGGSFITEHRLGYVWERGAGCGCFAGRGALCLNGYGVSMCDEEKEQNTCSTY